MSGWSFRCDMLKNRNVGKTMALRIIHKLNGVNATEKKNISKQSQMDGLNHLCHDGDDWGMICHHRRCALYEVIVRGTLSATAKVSATLDGPLRGIFDGMEIWGMPRALVW